MTPEVFLGKFETLAATPNALNKLRAFVLALAVAGRLQEGHGTWPSRPLKELASKIGSGATPLGGRETYLATGVPLIRSMNVYYRGFQSEGLVYLSDQQAAELSNVEVQSGDVLLNITGASIGRVSIAPPEMAGARVNQHVMIIRPLATISNRFLAMFLANPAMQRMINEIEVGATRQALTKGMVENFEIPVPPLAEQWRIVTKVDELMALCDRLEAQQQQREHAHAALTHAALARFANAPKGENLEYLFQSSYSTSPEELRKAILTLAVRGELCDQSPLDGPVDVLLAANDERRKRTAADDARADAERQDLLSADDRWDIPVTWKWRGLADLVLFIDYRGRTPKKVDRGVRLLTAKNVRRGEVTLYPEEFISEAEYDEWMTRGFPNSGDVLFTTEAPMGFAAVVRLPERFALAQRVICFQSYGAVDGDFLVIQVLSDQFQRILDRNGTGVTAKGIKASKLKQLPIAVPPLAEQRRIVAKVNDLMALVDRLEADLAAARGTGEALMDAVVHELIA